jgi:membrane protein implicated in regulation of membrane protease activity
MDAVTVTFLGIGCLSLLLLVLSLFGGRTHVGHLHIGHLHLGDLHIGHFHFGHAGHASPTHGDLSLPVIAGFLGAFGFGGAIAAQLASEHRALVAGGIGLLAAFPTAWGTGRLVDAAMNMPTDATVSSGDLVGTTGVVITPVPVGGGYGEVRLFVAGQPMKFNARSAQPLALGTHVFVIEVPSPTSVLVEPTPQIP